MANELTGDYDVVAEFTVAAVNRVMAGMHRGNRFPHSMSVRVDENPKSKKSMSSIVDRYGDAITDQVRLGQAGRSGGATSIPPHADVIVRNLDPVVNDRRRDTFPDPIGLLSFLQGIAQLQLGAPTIDLPADASATATVRTPVMLRYFPDPGSMSLPEFLRGEILTTLGVRTVTSNAGPFIDVGLQGPAGNIHFNQFWPPTSLDPDQLAAVNKVLRKSLITRFQPSSSSLPDDVASMDFKTLPEVRMVAAMMSLAEGATPSPDSMETVFLRDGDHFALAVNGDSITGPFAVAVNAAISPRQLELDTRFDWVSGTWHLFTRAFVRNATVQLQDVAAVPVAAGSGQILLTIPVQVLFGWKNKPFFVPDPQNFDFTITQAFTLSLSGGNVGLQPLGTKPAVNIPSNVPAQIANAIRPRAENLFINAWNSRQVQIQDEINKALSVDRLQRFLRELMNPPLKQDKDTPAQKRLVQVDPQLTYDSFEIKRSGIVLHGSLALPDWPAAHVEFELNPWTADGPNPEYNALNSWVPGGSVQEYVWSYRGSATPPDRDTFVSSKAPPVFVASAIHNSVCLGLKGFRLSASGPVVAENPVSRRCKGTTIPKAALMGFNTDNLLELPNIGLRRPALVHDPRPEVVAHASPWVVRSDENTANYLIHFPDRESAAHLDSLTRALEQSGRSDTATAILCVLTPDQIASVQPIDGVMFADDTQGWERLFDISSRPASVLLSPSGEVAWRHQGGLACANLAAALEKHLAAGGYFIPQFLDLPLRIGQRAPNFLFETAPGQRLTLRKLAGRLVVLLFMKSFSEPSLETLRSLHKAACQPGAERPVILAIIEGEEDDCVHGLTAAHESSAVIVPDSDRQISRAYGVGAWPTTVFLDAEGDVQEIRYGLITEEDILVRVESKPSVQPEKEY